MILSSLANLARREGLVDNPHYETKEVHWQLVLKPDGRFVSLESLLRMEPKLGRAQGRPRGPNWPIPRPLPGAARTGTAPDAGFLVENPSFVLGVDLTKEQRIAQRKNEAQRRTRAYRKLVEEGAIATGDVALSAVLGFLNAPKEVHSAQKALRDRQQSGEIASNHLIVPRIESDDGPVHLRNDVARYWSDVRSRAQGDSSIKQCLVTGTAAPSIDKHPPIKKVPGGSPSGVAIVSFNSPAFESYGFQRNDNAPVSRAAAEAYTSALNRLLDPTFPDPRASDTRLPEQRVVLSDDTVAVFWTDEDSPVPAVIVPAIRDGDPEAMAAIGGDAEVMAAWRAAAIEAGAQSVSPEPVRAAYRAPWSGIRPEHLSDRHPFRLLVLSGGQGRATVRAFHSSQVSAVVSAVQQWFADIAISTIRGKPSLYRLLSALAVHGDREKLSPNLAGEVFLAILTAEPLPASVLEAGVRRCRSEPNSRDVSGRKLHNLKVTPERASLLRAWLNRAWRDPSLRSQLVHQRITFQEVKPKMNPHERNRGYLLGRMFACIERMQVLALGEVGASITDRYFSSACATPQAVFPRLLKSEVHHFRKAREGRYGGSARWLSRQIDELASWLVGGTNGMAEGESVEAFLRRTAGHTLAGFPTFLPLPEQGLFALGYHQQRAEFFTKRLVVEEELEKSAEAADLLPTT